MDYNHIARFLDKFKTILSRGEEAHALIADIISGHISQTIPVSTIKTKGTIIKIEGSPLLRNEILMRKEKILSEISDKISSPVFTDIR